MPAGLEPRDADARRDPRTFARKRGYGQIANGPQDGVGDVLRGRFVPVRQQDGELVAAQSRDHVTLTHPCPERLREAHDQLVAGTVAAGVVEVLEVVEVENQQGARRTVTRDACQVACEFALEATPIEQARQRVVIGHVGQQPFVPAAFGDVLNLGDEVQRPPIGVSDQRDADRNQHGMSARVQVPLLGCEGRSVARKQSAFQSGVRSDVVGMRNAFMRQTDQLLASVADKGAERVVDALVTAVDAEDHHPDSGLVEGAAKTLFACPQGQLGGATFGEVARDLAVTA